MKIMQNSSLEVADDLSAMIDSNNSDIISDNSTLFSSTIASTANLPVVLEPSTATMELETLVDSGIIDTTDSDSSFFTLTVIATVLFIVAILLIAKVVISYHRKRSSIITTGSMRWRLSTLTGNPVSASSSNAAIYSAMPDERCNFSSLDMPYPDARLDWERQFFDENVYSQQAWEHNYPSRLRLDSERLT